MEIYMLEIVLYYGTRDAMVVHTSAHRTSDGRATRLAKWISENVPEHITESVHAWERWQDENSISRWTLLLED